MKKNWQLMMVLVVSAVALVFAFILKQPLIAQGLITVMGSIIALIMFGGMVKTIRSGNFGVDLLAITAVVATLAVSQYWAAMIVLLMLTGGDAWKVMLTKASSELKQLFKTHQRQLIGWLMATLKMLTLMPFKWARRFWLSLKKLFQSMVRFWKARVWWMKPV